MNRRLAVAACAALAAAATACSARAVDVGVDKNGHVNPELRVAAQHYADALQRADAAALRAMSAPGYRQDRLGGVVAGYGGHPTTAVAFDGADEGGASVQFTVSCSPSKKARFWQPFFYVNQHWRPTFGDLTSRAAPSASTASRVSTKTTTPTTC